MTRKTKITHMETIAHKFKMIYLISVTNHYKIQFPINWNAINMSITKFNSEQIRQCESAIVPKCGQQNMSLPAHPAFQISNQPWKWAGERHQFIAAGGHPQRHTHNEVPMRCLSQSPINQPIIISAHTNRTLFGSYIPAPNYAWALITLNNNNM